MEQMIDHLLPHNAIGYTANGFMIAVKNKTYRFIGGPGMVIDAITTADAQRVAAYMDRYAAIVTGATFAAILDVARHDALDSLPC